MRKLKLSNLIFSILTMIVFIIFLFPFVWMLLGSLKTQSEVMDANSMFVFTPTFDNYLNVFVNNHFFRFMVNSFIVALGTTLFSLILGLPAAYSIARNKLHHLANIILFTRMVPPIAFLIPWFILFTKLGLVDSFTGLILSNMVIMLPFIIWIMIPYFESTPMEIEEAGLIEGCSRTQIFLKLVLPISVPGIITCSMMSFIFTWNNFLFSVIFAGDKTKTLPVAVFNFMSYSNIDWGALMAAAFIITLPIIIMAIVMHRYIVSGLAAGVGK